ncbi:hypothetical protein D8I35_03465 [Corticibacter populi]|uniref:Uncharacterized protein n=1 Tax=Corticibacter populi TaxID=1550736 RepID=A0A3M6QYU2_9BURK|nr:hypothetical protein [Corticibacter populi]RMX08184.1 hypothetical protein D8I35_03465 [Corticibacter populi]RZS35450.1 hypothetical protein EV687_0517 [Corticibacter populi]
MSSEALLKEVGTLVSILNEGAPVALGAIPWASPVVSFGNPAVSKVATLGLNPSNLEFVDRVGEQLLEPYNRFESLGSLRATNWSEVARLGVQRIWETCEDYFFRNPYDQWFKRLDRILAKTGASYYSRIGESACHLDLVPFATANKWSALPRGHQARLIELGAPSLARTLSASDIRVLVLNGATVVREFSRLVVADSLRSQVEPSWALQDGRVQGISYIGRISEVGSIPLRRKLLVLGFNHNIQSSFGVTTQAIANISTWIGRQSAGVLV